MQYLLKIYNFFFYFGKYALIIHHLIKVVNYEVVC
jgi:hypothetical protein